VMPIVWIKKVRSRKVESMGGSQNESRLVGKKPTGRGGMQSDQKKIQKIIEKGDEGDRGGGDCKDRGI